MIKKVLIRNYRMFKTLDVEFNKGVNIIVGDNDSGKSTLIEAVGLALTGKLHGKHFSQELSPYLINLAATREYIQTLKSGKIVPPPEVIIEVYLEDFKGTEILRGTNNLTGEDACGIRIQAALSNEFSAEYLRFIDDPETISLVPVEYFKIDWSDFSGNRITARSVPISTSLIDATTIRLQSGIDSHLQEIIKSHLEPADRAELSRQYRSMREEFGTREPVKNINAKLQDNDAPITDKKFSLGIDISQRFTWESSLVAHLDDLPFPFFGKGEQQTIKTLLALGRKATDAHVVLIEEPEAHLSYANLKLLLRKIEDRCKTKQVLITTHSSYVINKMGLDKLLLLGSGNCLAIRDLQPDTVDFFKKLPGYDTLRLVLSRGAYLVEGPSDELVLQRAYMDATGRLPGDDGFDVISVGLSHKRFIEIAHQLGKPVKIITDNDGKSIEDALTRFNDFLHAKDVSFHIGEPEKGRTLEPQIVHHNDLGVLNKVLKTSFSAKDELEDWMTKNKTASALAIFESDLSINMPDYINEAIGK